MFSRGNKPTQGTNESGSSHCNLGFASHPRRCFRARLLISSKQWKAIFLLGVPFSPGMIEKVSYLDDLSNVNRIRAPCIYEYRYEINLFCVGYDTTCLSFVF